MIVKILKTEVELVGAPAKLMRQFAREKKKCGGDVRQLLAWIDRQLSRRARRFGGLNYTIESEIGLPILPSVAKFIAETKTEV